MMKKIFLSFAALALAFSAQAQTMDEELSSLVSVVKMLRDGSSASYSKVADYLKKDSKWTPMNETGTVKAQECRPSEISKRFKLNRILSQVDEGRKFVATHGDMLNGEDERYNYSLYERSVKATATVEYTLKGREGRQTFVIVPYLASGSGLSAEITLANGKTEKFQSGADGILIYESSTASLAREDVIRISVANASGANQAFVLLNHNTRSR